MMVRLSEVQRYTGTLARLSDASRTSVESAIATWMGEHPDASVAECREFAKNVIAAAVERYGDAASVNATRLYDETMAAEGVMVEPAAIYDGPNTERIDRTVRRQAAKLAGDEPDQIGFAAQVAVLARDMVHWAANETIEGNVERDSKTRNGGSVRFARIPTRPNPCPWCAMLASRGFVYVSADTAEAASHRHCACIVMPGVEGVTEVEGYDPDYWYDYWQNPDKYADGATSAKKAAAEGAGASSREIDGWYSQFANEVIRATLASGELFEKAGTPGHVSLTDAESMMLENADVMHTHTSTIGGTFSGDDVELLTSGWHASHEVNATLTGRTYKLVRLESCTEDSARDFAADFVLFERTTLEDLEYEEWLKRDSQYERSLSVESAVEAQTRLKPLLDEWLRENAGRFGYGYTSD